MIADQKESVKSWADFNNVTIEKFFIDKKIIRTGKNKQYERPQLDAARQYQRKKSIDLLLIVDLGYHYKDEDVDIVAKEYGTLVPLQKGKRKYSPGYSDNARASGVKTRNNDYQERSIKPAIFLELTKAKESERMKGIVEFLNKHNVAFDFRTHKFIQSPLDRPITADDVIYELVTHDTEDERVRNFFWTVFQEGKLTETRAASYLNLFQSATTPQNDTENWTRNKVSLSEKHHQAYLKSYYTNLGTYIFKIQDTVMQHFQTNEFPTVDFLAYCLNYFGVRDWTEKQKLWSPSELRIAEYEGHFDTFINNYNQYVYKINKTVIELSQSYDGDIEAPKVEAYIIDQLNLIEFPDLNGEKIKWDEKTAKSLTGTKWWPKYRSIFGYIEDEESPST